jgi:hypothetical protein
LFDQSLFICDVNSGHLYINKTEITQRESLQTKIFKISYYVISEVLKNEMITIIEVRCTLSHSRATQSVVIYAVATRRQLIYPTWVLNTTIIRYRRIYSNQLDLVAQLVEHWTILTKGHGFDFNCGQAIFRLSGQYAVTQSTVATSIRL